MPLDLSVQPKEVAVEGSESTGESTEQGLSASSAVGPSVSHDEMWVRIEKWPGATLTGARKFSRGSSLRSSVPHQQPDFENHFTLNEEKCETRVIFQQYWVVGTMFNGSRPCEAFWRKIPPLSSLLVTALLFWPVYALLFQISVLTRLLRCTARLFLLVAAVTVYDILYARTVFVSASRSRCLRNSWEVHSRTDWGGSCLCTHNSQL